MNTKIFAAAALIIMNAYANAQGYQVELDAKYTRYDFGRAFHDYQAGGKYYFEKVSTENVPLAEAAFLGKNSNAFVNISESPSQYGSSRSTGVFAGGELYVPEDYLYAQVGVTKSKAGDFSSDDWFTAVGVTPFDGLLVFTRYSHDAGYDANLHVKYVTPISESQFINITASVADYDAGTLTTLGGDYYLDKTLSIGAEYRTQNSNDMYTLRARKFFTESFSVDAAYSDNTEDGNMAIVGVGFRF